MWNCEVSPDRRWVAWSWTHDTPSDVFVAPVDGTAPPVRLTDTQESTVLASWTPDSKGVVVGQDRDGNNRTELFRVDLDAPCVMRRLTESSPSYYINIEGAHVHPNGRWLVYAANLDEASGREIEESRVYRHDLTTGERVALAKPRTGHWITMHMNDQGSHILYTRSEPDPAGEQVWLVDIDGREDREVVNVGDRRKARASWFPDGRRMLVLAETTTHKRVGMRSIDDTGIHWLFDDPARNIESAYVPRGSSRAVAIDVRDTRPMATLLNIETGAEEAFSGASDALIPIAPVGGDIWLARTYSSRKPDEIVRVSRVGATPRLSVSRTGDYTALGLRDFTPAQEYRWRSVDGVPVQGWLYRAGGSAIGTIVSVHGGPTAHDADRIDPGVQYLVHRGFNVLQPNYRGSTGFGQTFMEMIKEDGWGGREQDDIRTGIEALIAGGIAAPRRVGITGVSYGGYSSWCAITRWPPEIVAAAAPICGMTDLVVDYESTMPMLRPYSEEMMGGTPATIPERYHDRSPANFVANIRGRLLIVQGLTDPNVTPENVRAVTAALDRSGIPYELLTFEDEGHGIWREKNLRVLWPRLADFFASAFASAS